MHKEFDPVEKLALVAAERAAAALLTKVDEKRTSALSLKQRVEALKILERALQACQRELCVAARAERTARAVMLHVRRSVPPATPDRTTCTGHPHLVRPSRRYILTKPREQNLGTGSKSLIFFSVSYRGGGRCRAA